MKKLLTLVACLSLVASLAIGGSIAYLTDRDSEANVFTMGNVEIDLNEKFDQLAQLLPGVKIEKEATITNTGETPAYVWMTLAVPAELDREGSAATNPIHWNVPGAFWDTYSQQGKYVQSAIDMGYLPEGSGPVALDKTWDLDSIEMDTVDINGGSYHLYTLLYNSILAPNEVTNIGLNQVYMDAYIDIDTEGNMFRVKGGEVENLNWNINEKGNPTIYVSAYGIQAEGFAATDDKTATQVAYEAYMGQWGDDRSSNGAGVEYAGNSFEIGADTEKLQDAFNAGGDVTLTDDADAGATTIPEGKKVNLDLNEKTFDGQITNNGEVNVSGGSIVNDGRGFTNNGGTASVTDVNSNAGSASDYSDVAMGAGATTVYENVNLDSKGGGIGAVGGAKVIFKSGSVAVNSASTSGRYNFYTEGAGSEITIEGGEFSFSPTLNQKRAYICAGAGTTVYVKGGTFGKASTRSGYTAGILGEGTVIITGGTFGFDPSAWVADGYEAVKSGSTWTVSAK